jgi:HSP20 family protein
MELDKRDESTRRDLQQLLILRERVSELAEGVAPQSFDLKLDLLDLGDAYRLIVDLPGVAQDDLEIALRGRLLTIAGLREMNRSEQAFRLRERRGGHFQRTVELPGDVHDEGSSAQLREGLLILHLPKA